MRIVDLPGGWIAFYDDVADVELYRVHPPDRGFTVEQLDQLCAEQRWTLTELVQFADHMRERESAKDRLRQLASGR